MTDTGNNGFQPDEVEATRGREQGLGVGERELQRQRDVGDVSAAPEQETDYQSTQQDAQQTDSEETLDENLSVLGKDEDDIGYTTQGDANAKDPA